MICRFKDLSYRCGKVEKVCINNIATEKKEASRSRGDLIEALVQDTTGQETLQRKRFIELASSKAILVDTYRYKLLKKPKVALGKKFLIGRVVDLWNGLNESTVAVDSDPEF